MKRNNPHLSVIIPIYNEAKRLDGVQNVLNFLKKKSFDFEIILVNDGSNDSTLRKLSKFKDKEIKIISYSKNKGKGFAIKKGMLQASGNYRLFMDIDLSTPIEELDNFLPLLEKSDILIGTRKKKGANLITRQPKMRETLGKVFTSLSRQMLNSKVSDFTCGFKCFSQKASEKIFKKLTINRWGFDAEIIFIAQKKKLSIKEIPVTWSNNPNTKVKIPDAIINSLFELIKIRYNDFKKYYD